MNTSQIQYMVLCIAKLGKGRKSDPDILSKAVKHNLRKIPNELGFNSKNNIDPRKSHLNFILRGGSSPEDVVNENKRLMDLHNAKVLRKDNIRGVELIFSLPYQFTVNVYDFFEDFVCWVEEYFKNIPILSAVVHLDEPQPHAHVILLPIINGKLNGHKLMGGIPQLNAMRKSCHDAIGRKYGLALEGQRFETREQLQRDAELIFDGLCNVNETTLYLRVLHIFLTV